MPDSAYSRGSWGETGAVIGGVSGSLVGAVAFGHLTRRGAGSGDVPRRRRDGPEYGGILRGAVDHESPSKEIRHRPSAPRRSRTGRGVTGDLVRYGRLPRALGGFYLVGGVGLYHVRVDVTSFSSAFETKVAFNGGVGVLAATRAARMFWEARFISVRTSGGTTSFIPISAGVSFGLN